MEVALVVVLVGAILIALIVRISSGGSEPAKPSERSQESLERPLASDQPPRFDATSAKHLHESRVLTGAAYIIDGDSIRIKGTQIRLFGVDAPELNHPYGKKAKWALHRLCSGQIIRAEIVEEDVHGRTVAHCYLPDGRDLSAEMVKEGLAIDWPKFSGGKYRDLETSDARKKLFLADARQKGRMQVWAKFEATRGKR